jgi:hypothetical protein
MYSFEENSVGGNPYLELIIDAEKIDKVNKVKRLQFGIKKAKMIMNSIDQIKLFCDTNGDQPTPNSKICIRNKENDIICYCKKYNSFKMPYGKEIYKPYLKLWIGNTNIGFGLEKAKGILFLRNQIEDFIAEYSQ